MKKNSFMENLLVFVIGIGLLAFGVLLFGGTDRKSYSSYRTTSYSSSTTHQELERSLESTTYHYESNSKNSREISDSYGNGSKKKSYDDSYDSDDDGYDDGYDDVYMDGDYDYDRYDDDEDYADGVDDAIDELDEDW